MKLDFTKAFVTRLGGTVKDSSFERAMVSKAFTYSKDINFLSEVAEVLDKNSVTFTDIVKEQGEDLTFGVFFSGLLDGPKRKGDEELKAKDILTRRLLADKIFGAKEPISLKRDEVVLLEKLVEKAYNEGSVTSFIVGQALEFIEEKDIEEKEKV